MGAAYNSTILKGTREEVKEQFRGIQETDRHENGHSYSGGFGMCPGLDFVSRNRLPEDLMVEDTRAVEEWVVENQDKWGCAYAVEIGEGVYYIGAWCSS